MRILEGRNRSFIKEESIVYAVNQTLKTRLKFKTLYIFCHIDL